MAVFTHHDSDHHVCITSVDTPCIIEKFPSPRIEQLVDAVFDRGSEHLPTCLYTRTHTYTHVYACVCGQANVFVYVHVYARIGKVAHVSCKLQQACK